MSLCGVVPTPTRALEAERFLAGKVLEDAVLQKVGDLVARCVLPVDGSEGESFRMVEGLTRRAITEALSRVRDGAQP